MFTPHNVAGRPDDGIVLNKIRVTRGKYVGTGEGFELIDDYSVAASMHKMLPHAWVGTTEFREVDQQIKNIVTHQTIEIAKDKSVAWADMLSGDEETSDTRVCGALTSLAPRARCPDAPLLSGEAMPGLHVGEVLSANNSRGCDYLYDLKCCYSSVLPSTRGAPL